MIQETIAQRVAFGEALVEIARDNPDLVVLDGDLANSTRADIFHQAFPDRFLEMGIAEQNMVGVAAGLATVGFIPWLSSFAAFLVSRDLDQIRVVVAQPNLPVKFAGAYSGILTGSTGKTHQSVDDLAVMRAMPHMTVVAPADGVEVRAAMMALTTRPGPAYMRLTRDAAPVITDRDQPFVVGEARLLRDGSDVSLISTGAQSVRVLEAATLLAQDGISALVLHVPTLKPLDEAAIVAAAERTGRVFVSEEHSIIGGLGSAVAEVLSEQRPTRVRRHGLSDVFGESGPNEALLEKYGFSASSVAASVRDWLQQG